MSKILAIHLKHNNVEQEALDILANATRYVPRHAVQFAKNIKDYAILHDLTSITADDMRKALHNLSIDEFKMMLIEELKPKAEMFYDSDEDEDGGDK